MEVITTALDGVLILEPRIFRDSRGYFFESFSQREFDSKVVPLLGHSVRFVQDNESMSSYGVMRGLHYQRMPYTQSKLVRVVQGAVLDVAVDIRRGSSTFGQHVAVELTAENRRQLFIPRGFAQADGGINILDETLHIDWRIPIADAILSEKDLKHSRLADAVPDFDINDRLY